MDDPNDDYDNQPRSSSQPFLDNNDNQTRRPSPWHKRRKRSKSSGRREPGNTTDAQGTLLNRLSRDGNNNDWPSDDDGRSKVSEPTRSYLFRSLPHGASALFGGGIIFTILVFAALWALSGSSITMDLPEDAVSSSGTFGIPLHPEQHIHRNPINITQHWKITSEIRYPDGVRKNVYLVDGQFPGPVIECRSMDRLFIHVTNELVGEDVSIHWHGLNMKGANAMDGVSGVTQCPIQPGKTFTYEFTIDAGTSGTFWYHAYLDRQKADGLYGGLIVHNAEAVHTDLRTYGYQKEALFLIGDWYHRSGQELLDWYSSMGFERGEPTPDSLLINGAGKFTCPKAPPGWPVKCVEKWADKTPGLFNSSIYDKHTRMRIVNVGSLAGLDFAFASGYFEPITVDGGHPILIERSARIGVLSPGQRVDLVLRTSAEGPHEARRMHIFLHKNDLRYPNPVLTEHQSFPYVKSKTIPTPDWEHLGLGFDDESVSLEPYDLAVALTPNAIDIAPETADQRIVVYTTSKLLFDDNDRPIGFINESSWGVSDWYPLITEPRRKWDSNTQELVPFIPMPNSKPIWVDLVLYNPKDYSDPFHLHGYSFYVVASESSLSGWRSYMLDPYTGGTIWLSPAKKDTILVPRKGHVVLRFLADNPGIWMFHSSVMFHMATGTAMGILVGGNEQHTVVDDRAEDSCPFDRPY